MISDPACIEHQRVELRRASHGDPVMATPELAWTHALRERDHSRWPSAGSWKKLAHYSTARSVASSSNATISFRCYCASASVGKGKVIGAGPSGTAYRAEF
jgi:hypothetical protein